GWYSSSPPRDIRYCQYALLSRIRPGQGPAMRSCGRAAVRPVAGLSPGGRRRPGLRGPRSGSGATAAVSRVLLGHPLVTASIVAGQAGHQLLRVLPLHPGEELRRPLPAQRGRVPAVVSDADRAVPILVVEA